MTPAPPSPSNIASIRTNGWNRRTVAPYLGVLVLAVLLALALRVRIYEHYEHIAHHPDPLLDGTRTALKACFWGQFLVFWWLGLRRRLPTLLRHQPWRPRQLMQAAGLASGLSLVNLFSESLAIYRLKIDSYDLLFESLLLYTAVTLNFLFWYWVVDHPPRDPGHLWEPVEAAPRSVSMPYGIVFPEEALERDLFKTETWRPAFTDYLYFTLLSSNCFGAPEGHSLVGAPIKRLHMLHSLAMMAVFIIILARAINTLS